MVQGAGSFTGMAGIAKRITKSSWTQARESIVRAAAAKVPNVIGTLFGATLPRDEQDEEGIANCVEGLNKAKGFAEDNGVCLCIELLNSKVDHKDYQGDHTKFGAEIVKAGRLAAASNCFTTSITCRSWRAM